MPFGPRWRPGCERRNPGLIPERDARVVVLALVPTVCLSLRVFVGRDPAVVFESDPYAGVENHRVLYVPSIGARVATDNAPLVEVGNAVIGRVGLLKPPGTQEVV